MKILLLLFFAACISGCTGLAVGTVGVFERENKSFTSKELTKQQFISKMGEPDDIWNYKKCEVLTYYDGYTWGGIGAFVLILPIPLMLPTGYKETDFYFIDNISVREIYEFSDITASFGYTCGSNDCSWLNPKGNTHDKRKVEVSWCD